MFSSLNSLGSWSQIRRFFIYSLPLGILFFLGTLYWSSPSVSHQDNPRELSFPFLQDAGWTPAQALLSLGASNSSSFLHQTHLSRDAFWWSIQLHDASPAETVLTFNSRHLVSADCWNANDSSFSRPVAHFDRRDLTSLHSGLPGLSLTGIRSSDSFLCKGFFIGPARLTAQIQSLSSFQSQVHLFEIQSGLLLGAIGTLIAFMLVTALVNRSFVYVSFAFWLFLNLRMAELSLGSDFSLFGMALPYSWLIPQRQWGTALFTAMTAVMFLVLFGEKLTSRIDHILMRAALTLSALLLVGASFLSFELYLPLLWSLSLLITISLFSLSLLLIFRERYFGLFFYVIALCLTVFSAFSEVVAAAFGFQHVLVYFNSVTAAIGSSFAASLALAFHMRQAKDQTRILQQRLAFSYEASPVGLASLTSDGHLVRFNSSLRSLLQSTEASLTHAHQWLSPSDWELLLSQSYSSEPHPLTLKIAGTDGDSSRWLLCQARMGDDGLIEASFQDSTERVIYKQRLEYLASHDPLTGSLNLRGLHEFLESDEALGRWKRIQSIAYFDLDRFKLINDLYGHAAGDDVLRQVKERMAFSLGPEDRLARVGGDEFVVIFSEASLEVARERARLLIDRVSGAPYLHGDKTFALSVSGGLVEAISVNAATSQDLISAADSACRLAKKQASVSGEGRMVVFAGPSGFGQRRSEELFIASHLEQNVPPPGLHLLMQPIMSLTQPHDSLNFEVLLRMKMEDGRVIGAPTLIETAESTGKVAVLDSWVLERALDWIDAHQHRLSRTKFICVNLSAGSLNDESFLARAFELFSRRRMAASLLCLEITESVALSDVGNTRIFIEKARSLGLRVALDDFGAGYCSLGYLKDLPADALKVDGSLVQDSRTNPAALSILSSICGLVRGLGMRAIAEWTENVSDLRSMATAGFDYAQGYAISPPVDPALILQANSSADFIQDPATLQFVSLLQSGNALELFDSFDHSNKLLH